MKNISLKKSVVAAAATLLFSAGSAQAAFIELAVNGDFETGDFTGWEVFPQSGTNVITAGNGGGFAGTSTLPSGPADNLIKQSNRAVGLVQPGDAIKVTFDARGFAGVSAVTQIIMFSEFAGGGATPTFFDFFLNADADTWTSYEYNTFAGGDVAGGITLAFKVACGGVAGCTADVDFDNVSFQADVAAVPVPAAAWLFGSALLGLTGLAKRKKAA
jgi:hypothetical protein